MELTNLTFDQDLAAHLERAFGPLVADGGESRGEAGGHDDGTRDAIGFQCCASRVGDCAVLDVTGGLALACRCVDAAQAHLGGHGQRALREGCALASKSGQDVELGFAESANVRRGHAITFRSREIAKRYVFERSTHGANYEHMVVVSTRSMFGSWSDES